MLGAINFIAFLICLVRIQVRPFHCKRLLLCRIAADVGKQSGSAALGGNFDEEMRSGNARPEHASLMLWNE
jgi:hypothetical protein